MHGDHLAAPVVREFIETAKEYGHRKNASELNQ